LHLLLFGETLADDGVHGGFDEGRRYTIDYPGRSWSDMFSEPAMEADCQTLCQKEARANDGLGAASADQDTHALASSYTNAIFASVNTSPARLTC